MCVTGEGGGEGLSGVYVGVKCQVLFILVSLFKCSTNFVLIASFSAPIYILFCFCPYYCIFQMFQLVDLKTSPEFHTSVRVTCYLLLRTSSSLTLLLPIELPIHRRNTVQSSTDGRPVPPFIIFRCSLLLSFHVPQQCLQF